jgi:hypothetical protein
MLSRFTVPAVAQHHHVAATGGGVRDVELVAVRVPAEVRQRVEEQDLRALPEPVPVVLRGGQPARAGADDDAVVGLTGVGRLAGDARPAHDAVHVGRVRGPVDLEDLGDDVIRLPGEPGRGRRIVAGRRAVPPAASIRPWYADGYNQDNRNVMVIRKWPQEDAALGLCDPYGKFAKPLDMADVHRDR